MKILVAIKRVVDYNVHVRLKPDGSDVDIAGAKMLGIYAIKVKSYDEKSEPAYFLPIRLLERLLVPDL